MYEVRDVEPGKRATPEPRHAPSEITKSQKLRKHTETDAPAENVSDRQIGDLFSLLETRGRRLFVQIYTVGGTLKISYMYMDSVG